MLETVLLPVATPPCNTRVNTLCVNIINTYSEANQEHAEVVADLSSCRVKCKTLQSKVVTVPITGLRLWQTFYFYMRTLQNESVSDGV